MLSPKIWDAPYRSRVLRPWEVSKGGVCGLRRIIRLFREHKLAKKAPIVRHEPVAQLGEPDQRRPAEGAHQPAGVANDLQDEQRGPPALDDPSLRRNDVNGPFAGFIQRRRHRRRGARLVGDGIKFLLGILAPDPGDCSPSEASVAVPDEPMLVRLNGLGGCLWLFQVWRFLSGVGDTVVGLLLLGGAGGVEFSVWVVIGGVSLIAALLAVHFL